MVGVYISIYFSKSIVQKIINPELWEDCNSCQCAGRCPIKANRDQLAKQFDRICAFIENYYRYLYENDKRLTIRQIIRQISFALTGNLSCSSIQKKHYKEPFFNYNFANLFFGYCGIDPIRSARQIKGIEQLQIQFQAQSGEWPLRILALREIKLPNELPII